jgi:hypothetical protein
MITPTSNTVGTTELRELLQLVDDFYTTVEGLVEAAKAGTKIAGFKLTLLKQVMVLGPRLQQALQDIQQTGAEVRDLTEQEFIQDIGPLLLRLQYRVYQDTVANVRS